MIKIIKKLLNKDNEKKIPVNFHPEISAVSQNIIRLGSVYGGWSFLDHKNLYKSTILSFGSGEDITFDIEYINKYEATVILVDPTPRAVEHYSSVLASLGSSKTEDYTNDGNQPISSYDLCQIKEDNLYLEQKAIWTENCSIPFFKPSKSTSVSHSIVNFKNNYNKDLSQPHILVKTITINELMKKYNLEELPLVKMDIEGAETKVIVDFFNKGIHPDQILVEFDGLQIKNDYNINLYFEIDKLFREHGYLCASFEKPANLLYVSKHIV
tara:strand:+ start:1625 stop:2431 length:807 start_codon:yes stop_codon:yes gene_type:complete